MDSVPCLGCSEFFIPRNKLQNYCSKPECQKARKALWQKEKMKNASEYKEAQKLSNQKWLFNNPDYWKNYRQKNPEKTIRNRMLQRIRNRRRYGIQDMPVNVINLTSRLIPVMETPTPVIKISQVFSPWPYRFNRLYYNFLNVKNKFANPLFRSQK